MELSFDENDFLSCCGSTQFAKLMASFSPFSSHHHAVSIARDIWFNNVHVNAWLQAFSAHPSIGQTRSPSHASQTSAQFSHHQSLTLFLFFFYLSGSLSFLYVDFKNYYFSVNFVFFICGFFSFCVYV